MKLIRVRKDTGVITAEADHNFSPIQTRKIASFSFSNFGSGRRNTSDMRVLASLDDALMIIRHYAQQGDPEAKRIVAQVGTPGDGG